MKITSSEFVKSFADARSIDIPMLPGIAFAGRSNVGKSSMINHLLNRKKLVKTSSTPGKTQLLNFFLINRSFYFVDLPGYGFANAPVRVKENWLKMTRHFLSDYPELRAVVQLLDIRHKPSRDDIAFRQQLAGGNIPYLAVASKADKIKRGQIEKSGALIVRTLNLSRKPIPHSTLKKIGRAQILREIQIFLRDSGKP